MSSPGWSRWLLWLAALTVSACAPRAEQLPKGVSSSLEVALNSNDLSAASRLFTEDAEILPESSQIVRGREAIDEYLRQQVAEATAFDTDTTTQLVRGDVAIDQGTYRVRDIARGKDVEFGKYMHVWKNENGAWKLWRVMYNTDFAPRASMSVADENASDEGASP